MANFTTPGVYDKEVDKSIVANPAGSSIGATVLKAPRGRINFPTRVSSNVNIIDNFGKPTFTSTTSTTPDYGYGLYMALEFVSQSDDLTITRVPTVTGASASIDFTATDQYGALVMTYDGVDTLEASYFEDGASATAGIPPYFEGASYTAPTAPNKIDYINDIELVSTTGVGTTPADNIFLFSALDPSNYGNDFAIGVEVFSEEADWRYNYDNEDDIDAFITTPSEAGIEALIAPRVFKIKVYQKKTKDQWLSITDTNYTAIETFYVSLEAIIDGENNSLFIKDVINGTSNYIYAVNLRKFTSAELLAIIGDATSAVGFSAEFKGGLSVASSDATNISGWDYYVNKDLINIDTVLVPTHNTTVKQYVDANVIAKRLDSTMVTQSGELTDDTVAEILEAEGRGYKDASYVALSCGYNKVFDVYSARNVWLPNCIYEASAFAFTDNVANVWDAPAGKDRGVIAGLEQNVYFDDAQLGELYSQSINPIKKFGDGIVAIWGQKTALRKNSQLGKIQVRRNLNVIKKTIRNVTESFIFTDNNTASTRLRVTNIISNYLQGILSAEGIRGFQVTCDESNNSDQDIANGILNIDVILQPTNAIEFVSITYTITSSDVTEVEG
jgi:hypothetical protein